MKNPALTREEIAYLLRGFSEGASPAASNSQSDTGSAAPAESLPGAGGDPGGLPLLPGWEQVAVELASRFSELFRSAAQILPGRTARASLGQFLLGCGPADGLCRVALREAEQPLWIRLDLPLARALVERLLGGPLAPSQDPSRALTDVERRLALRIVDTCAQAVCNVWSVQRSAHPADDAWVGIEHPWRTSRAPLVCCELQVQLEAARGNIALALPVEFAARASEMPDAQAMGKARPASVPPIRLAVVLTAASVPETELAGLEVGDLIPTEQRVDQPLAVELDGQLHCLARLGTEAGRKAIRIEEG